MLTSLLLMTLTLRTLRLAVKGRHRDRSRLSAARPRHRRPTRLARRALPARTHRARLAHTHARPTRIPRPRACPWRHGDPRRTQNRPRPAETRPTRLAGCARRARAALAAPRLDRRSGRTEGGSVNRPSADGLTVARDNLLRAQAATVIHNNQEETA